MLLAGLVGKRFERVLAFYLARADRYLDVMPRSAVQRRPVEPDDAM
jgi:hypothetical protein